MTKTCLILEDNIVSNEVLDEYSKMLKLETTATANAEDAMRACKENMPDCILLDWHMPGVDGLDFLKILREMPGGDKPTVIMCTCDELIGEKHNLNALGVKSFIAKPLHFDELKKALIKEGVIQS